MRSQPFKIAMLSLHSSPLAELGGDTDGGMSVYLREVSRELSRMGHRVDIFTRKPASNAPPVQDIDERVRLIHIQAGPSGPLSREETALQIPAMREALWEWPVEAYDAVHAHYWISGSVGRDWAPSGEVPFVQMFHTLERTKSRLLGDAYNSDERRISEEQALAHSADALTVGSARDRDSLIADYNVPPEKIHIVPGGLNTDIFTPQPQEEARKRAGLPDGRIALYVGRIEPAKGLETLLRALSLLRKEGGDNCNWRLFVIGGQSENPFSVYGRDGASGPSNQTYLGQIHDLSRQLGMTDRITFLGSKPQPDLVDFYAGADCCVFPSLYETFGLAVIEALGCGGVVVASDCGGYSHLLSKERAGLLVPPGDTSALAGALDRVCTDADLRLTLRRRAPFVGRRFSWEQTGLRLIELYGTLTRQRAGKGLLPSETTNLAEGKTHS